MFDYPGDKLHTPSTIREVFKTYRDSKDKHYAIAPRNCFAIYITQRVNSPDGGCYSIY